MSEHQIDGLFGFYRGVSIASFIVRRMNWRLYSHVSYIEGHVENNDLCGPKWEVEAWATKPFLLKGAVTKAEFWGKYHTHGTRVDLYRLKKPLTQEEHDKLVYELSLEIGKGYDFAGILGFVIRKDIENPKKWFCSELIFAKLLKIGRQVLARIKAFQVFPGLLANSNDFEFVGYVVVGEGRRVYPDITMTNCKDQPVLKTA